MDGLGVTTFSPSLKDTLGTCSTVRIPTQTSGYNLPLMYTFRERGYSILSIIVKLFLYGFVHQLFKKSVNGELAVATTSAACVPSPAS